MCAGRRGPGRTTDRDASLLVPGESRKREQSRCEPGGGSAMMIPAAIVQLMIGHQVPGGGGTHWTLYTSNEGGFVVDLPGKPTKTFTRTSRSRRGQVKVIVAQCDTPNVLYTAEKV